MVPSTFCIFFDSLRYTLLGQRCDAARLYIIFPFYFLCLDLALGLGMGTKRKALGDFTSISTDTLIPDVVIRWCGIESCKSL